MRHLLRLLTAMLLAVPLAAADAPPPPWWELTKISVQTFGDAYWIPSHHDPNVEGRNGFWFRRIYLTFDQTLAPKLAGRLRFEMNHPGDFTSTAALDPFVKDAFLRWNRSAHQQFLFGISQSPAFELVEQVWGYRHVEKTPLDLQRLVSTRETGIAALGDTGRGEMIRYHAMIGNGSGVGADNDSGKLGALSISLQPSKRLVFQLYGDYDDRAGGRDRSTVQAFAAWQTERVRTGLQWASQRREGTGPDQTLDVASIFSVFKLSSRLSVLARADRMLDPNPDGARIAYLPFDPSSKSTLLILGADLAIQKNLSLVPNVEFVDYDGPAGRDFDLVPRMTFFYRF